MSNVQAVVIIFVMGIAVQFTRWLPFLIFDKRQELPPIINYMGKVLPAAMMGLLVVYCFKDYDFADAAVIIPALVAAVIVAVLHLWKRNMVLSIALGTAVYMVLIRVF